jgi:hypothetical protein
VRPGFAGIAARRGAALALTMALAACGDASTPTGASTVAITPEPTPVTTVYELGSQVWYEGLVLTFDRVTATLDERGGLVDVLVGVANPGTDSDDLSGKIALVVGGTRIEPTRDSNIPDVPGGGSVAAVLTYELQAIPSIEDAVIQVGASPLHIARVPMTPGAGALVSYEPEALALAGSATAASLKITLRGGLLRSDLPDWWQELDAGLEALTLTYDVTYTGDFAGGLAFTGDNVALRLPDGSIIAARRDGHSQSVELIGSHKTKKGLFSRFEIPTKLTGSFALLVRNSATERTIKFTIGG